MDNVTFVKDDSGVEHAIIDRGNGEFTSMPKAVYDAQVAAQGQQSTETIPADEAKTK